MWVCVFRCLRHRGWISNLLSICTLPHCWSCVWLLKQGWSNISKTNTSLTNAWRDLLKTASSESATSQLHLPYLPNKFDLKSEVSGKKQNTLQKNKLQKHALERSIDPYVLPLLFQPSAQRQTFFQLHLVVFLVTWLAPQTRPVWCAAANKQQHLKYFEVTWQCEPECNSMDIKPCHCDGANQMGWSKPR